MAVPNNRYELESVERAIDEQNARFGVFRNHSWHGEQLMSVFVYLGVQRMGVFDADRRLLSDNHYLSSNFFENSENMCICYDCEYRKTEQCSCRFGYRAVCEFCIPCFQAMFPEFMSMFFPNNFDNRPVKLP